LLEGEKLLKVLVFSLSTPSSYVKNEGGASIMLRQLIMNWIDKVKLVVIGACQPGCPSFERLGSSIIIRVGGRYTAWLSMFIIYSRYFKGWADVVVENRHSYPLLTPLYVREPLVVIEHGLLGFNYFKCVQPHLAILGFIFEKLMGLLGYRRAHFVAVSNLCAIDLYKVGIPASNVDIVYPGVEIAQKPPGKKSHIPIITFIGVMDDRRKRVEDLIYAFYHYVLPKYPEAKLVICGGGKREAILKRARVRNVVFPGYISGVRKAVLLQATWIFAMPSIKETFSIACLEANAYGVPCVAYRISGLETLIDGVNAVLVQPGDVEGLGKAILSLIVDEKKRENLAAKAKQLASMFDWGVTAQRILEVLICKGGKLD
jgi:glycosyltransferase involved in cell wall biosynthesis